MSIWGGLTQSNSKMSEFDLKVGPAFNIWRLPWVFQQYFMDISRGDDKEVSKVFWSSFKVVSGRIQEYIKSVSLFLPGSFKVILRQFWGCFQEVSNIFHGISWVLHIEVLRKFCSLILLLHSSYHSYPNRRRAC